MLGFPRGQVLGVWAARSGGVSCTIVRGSFRNAPPTVLVVFIKGIRVKTVKFIHNETCMYTKIKASRSPYRRHLRNEMPISK